MIGNRCTKAQLVLVFEEYLRIYLMKARAGSAQLSDPQEKADFMVLQTTYCASEIVDGLVEQKVLNTGFLGRRIDRERLTEWLGECLFACGKEIYDTINAQDRKLENATTSVDNAHEIMEPIVSKFAAKIVKELQKNNFLNNVKF